MKRALCLTLAALFLLGLAGCGPKEAPDTPESDTPDPIVESESPAPEQKVWTAQEVKNLFIEHFGPTSLDIVDCVTAGDLAYDRVGVVLVADREQGSTTVAYVAGDGTYQQCQQDELLPLEDSQFTYVGDGVVTFRGDSQTDGPSTCTVTFAKEGTGVHFTWHTLSDADRDY